MGSHPAPEITNSAVLLQVMDRMISDVVARAQL